VLRRVEAALAAPAPVEDVDVGVEVEVEVEVDVDVSATARTSEPASWVGVGSLEAVGVKEVVDF